MNVRNFKHIRNAEGILRHTGLHEYSNLQTNKGSSASHYSKCQLKLITYKILIVARQLSRRGVSSDGRSNSHVQTIHNDNINNILNDLCNTDKRKQEILGKYITKSNTFNLLSFLL